MRLLIALITTLSFSVYSIPHNTEDELNNNLSASTDSVEKSLESQEDKAKSELEEQQFAGIMLTLKELNEL